MSRDRQAATSRQAAIGGVGQTATIPSVGHPDRQTPESGGVARLGTAHARAARRERQAAELLGTKRVKRSRYERAPDCEPVTLPCGVVLSPEVKTRKRLPALVVRALDQARGYGPAGSVPAAVLSETGGEPVIVLPLRAFRRIAGLDRAPVNDPQTALSFPDLGPDERRVLEVIAARLSMGARQYGPLDVPGDEREWRREAVEELLDGCVYLACEAMRRGR